MQQQLFLDLDGSATRCVVDGRSEAPVMVLVHEMGGAIESWDGVVAALQKHWRLVRYDVRGAGMAERLRGDVLIETLADDVARVLDRLGIDRPVCVAGGAVGAAIALCFAARHPGRVAAVAALSPALGVPHALRGDRHALADRATADGMRALETLLLGGGYPTALRELAPDRWETFRARWLGNDPESFRSTFRMLIELDFSSFYDRITCPVLAIGATLDPLRPPEQAADLTLHLRDATYLELSTGHHAAVQTPEPVADALHEFLFRHAGLEGATA